jgi:hypothetical protein
VVSAKEIVPELRLHPQQFAEPGENGLVFIGPKGGRLRRSTFRRTWTKARTQLGLPDLHFHDLRQGAQVSRQACGSDVPGSLTGALSRGLTGSIRAGCG